MFRQHIPGFAAKGPRKILDEVRERLEMLAYQTNALAAHQAVAEDDQDASSGIPALLMPNEPRLPTAIGDDDGDEVKWFRRRRKCKIGQARVAQAAYHKECPAGEGILRFRCQVRSEDVTPIPT